MSRRGSYLGGHTTLKAGSDLFSAANGSQRDARNKQMNKRLKAEAKKGLSKVAGAAIPGERARDLKRLRNQKGQWAKQRNNRSEGKHKV